MEQITTQQLKEKIESGDKFIVDFFATWCGPCKMLGTILERSGDKLGLPIYKYDVDNDIEFTGKLGVRSVPTLKIYEGGSEVKTHVGILQEAQFATFLN